MDDAELCSMVKHGVSLDGMAKMLGAPKHEIVHRLAQLGLEIPGRVPLDTVMLFRLWHDPSHTVTTIARALGVRPHAVYKAVSRYGLPPRKRVIVNQWSEEAAPDADEDRLSSESLRLAPTTEREAAKIRQSWSPGVRYSRRAQRCQPVSYDRIGIGVV